MKLLSQLFPALRPKDALRETAPSVRASRSLGEGLDPARAERLLSDAMVGTALNVKRLGVLAAPWRIDANGSSASAARNAEFVRAALDRMQGSVHGVLNAAMDAFAKGLSVQELVFAPERDGNGEDRIWLAEVRPKDPAHFRIERDAFARTTGLTLVLPGEPERSLPKEKFVLYAYRSSYARPRGQSDLEACVPHHEAKRALAFAWRLHLERFASPTVLGRFAPETSDADRAAMLDSLENLDRNAALVYPESFRVDTLGGTPDGSRGFMEAIEWHNREIARAILGQTLTTDEGRRVGSLAMGRVHLQVLLLQLTAIRRELADTVMTEGVIRPLIELNFGPAGPLNPLPRFAFEEARAGAFVDGTI